MRNAWKSVTFGLIAIGALVWTSAKSDAAVIATDTFVGTNGTNINGRTTETGALTWAAVGAGAATLQLSSNTVVISTNSGSARAYVPFTPGAASSIAVDGSLHPTNGGQWMALGFALASGDLFESTSSPLWLLMTGAGNYDLFKNGTATVLQAGAVPSYDSAGLNTVRLAYDVTTSIATLTLNGNTVYNAAPTGGINSAGITAAGFEFTQQLTTAAFDNFQLEAVVPEPSALMLLGMAIVPATMRRRNV